MYKEPKKNRIYQIKKQFELEVYIFNENPLVDWKNLAFTFYFFSCLLIQFFATLDPLTWFKNWRGLRTQNQNSVESWESDLSEYDFKFAQNSEEFRKIRGEFSPLY